MNRIRLLLLVLVATSLSIACSPVEQVIKQLRNEDAKVRLEAIKGISDPERRDLRVVEALAKTALGDPEASVRAAAVERLPPGGYEEDVTESAGARLAADTLIAVLRSDRDPSVRIAAAKAMGNYSQRRITEALLSALIPADWPLRASLAESLGSIRSTEHSKAFVEALERFQVDIESLCDAIERADGDAAIREALNQLQDAVIARNRLLATMSKGHTDPIMARPLGSAFDRARNVDSRLTAANRKKDFGRLDKKWGSRDWMLHRDLSNEIMQRLLTLGASGVEELLRLWAYEHYYLDVEYDLHKLKDPTAIAPLLQALGSPNSRVRMAALAGLRGLNDRQAVDPLVSLINREADPEVRGKAFWTLSVIDIKGHPTVAEVLVRALRTDRSKFVREHAAKSLGKLQTRESAAALIAALKDDSYNVRQAAADALWKGDDDARAVAALLSAMPDGHNTARYVKALRRLTDWQPSTDTERVYAWSADGDRASLAENWQLTHRVLMNDLKSGKPRRIEFSVSTFFDIGNPEVIPEMIEALNKHGTKDMAVLYLNSQQDDLRDAAQSWAFRNGYKIESVRSGHNRKFGGGR